jgi:hypothetical protein
VEVKAHLRWLTEVDFAAELDALGRQKVKTISRPGLSHTHRSRGQIWFEALAGSPIQGPVGSVWICDAAIGKDQARFLAVVPYSENCFPRARSGELGLEEGWNLAKYIR